MPCSLLCVPLAVRVGSQEAGCCVPEAYIVVVLVVVEVAPEAHSQQATVCCMGS